MRPSRREAPRRRRCIFSSPISANGSASIRSDMEDRMAEASILKVDAIRVIERGSGIRTWPLVVHQAIPHAHVTTGMSVYPVGQGAPLHKHNCDEQVTLLEGVGEVERDGRRPALVRYA